MDLKIFKILDHMKETVSKASGRKSDQIDSSVQELRKTHRELYINIESNRKLNQLEKDELDKETLYSECLQYQKNQLISNIQSFRAIQTKNYNSIKKNTEADKSTVLAQLETELSQRKQKKVQLQEIIQEQNALQREYAKKENQYFNQLPQALREVQQQLIPIAALFELPLLVVPQQQEYYECLPTALTNIYQKFHVKGIPIEIAKIKEPKLHNYELKITLSEGVPDPVKIPGLYDEIFPFTIIIRYCPTLDQLVFVIDRQNKLSSEEFFQGLYKGDSGDQIILNPTSEEDSNFNLKYLSYNWAKQLSTTLSIDNFCSSVKQRIYDILILKWQLEKLKKSEFIPFPGIQFQAQIKYFSNASLQEQTPFWYNLIRGEPLNKLNVKNPLLVEDSQLKSYLRLNQICEGEHQSFKIIIEKDIIYEIGIIIPQCYPQQGIRLQLLNNAIGKRQWFSIVQSLGACKLEALQLGYQITKLAELLGPEKKITYYQKSRK